MNSVRCICSWVGWLRSDTTRHIVCVEDSGVYDWEGSYALIDSHPAQEFNESIFLDYSDHDPSDFVEYDNPLGRCVIYIFRADESLRSHS